jgi:hypothetical protein
VSVPHTWYNLSVRQKPHLTEKENTMETETKKPRQAATLYSWGTSVEQISVKVNNLGNLEVRIGELTVVISAVIGEEVLELAKAFGKVEVTETITSTVRV